ncbi:MAG TPA: GIY-YIG nuclease family protein [Planctomycetota bacterium]|nr:GIY-YIG nuclease family protein [Planctomycetota bacterium]
MWYVYFLRCSDNSIYTGITTNLESRVKRHDQGNGCKYTSYRRPVKLIYSEKYPNKSQAAIRESYLKGLTRSKKEAIVTGSLRPDSNLGSV